MDETRTQRKLRMTREHEAAEESYLSSFMPNPKRLSQPK